MEKGGGIFDLQLLGHMTLSSLEFLPSVVGWVF